MLSLENKQWRFWVILVIILASLLFLTRTNPDGLRNLYQKFALNSKQWINTKRSLPERCEEFVYDGEGPIDCSAVNGFSYNEVTAYIAVFDEIVQEDEHYFLHVYNKDKDGRWFRQKFYLGKQEEYTTFREQYDNDYRASNHEVKMKATHYQLKDLPVKHYNQLLKNKEVIILIFNNKYGPNGLKRVSHVRYIAELNG